MVIGVTMINVLPGTEKKVFADLGGYAGVKDVYHVFGEFDFVIIIDIGTLKELNHVVDSIRANPNVTTTRTIIGADI